MIDGTILALFCCVYGIKPGEIKDMDMYHVAVLIDKLPIAILLTAGSPELASAAMEELKKLEQKANQPSIAEMKKQAKALGITLPKNLRDK